MRWRYAPSALLVVPSQTPTMRASNGTAAAIPALSVANAPKWDIVSLESSFAHVKHKEGIQAKPTCKEAFAAGNILYIYHIKQCSFKTGVITDHGGSPIQAAFIALMNRARMEDCLTVAVAAT